MPLTMNLLKSQKFADPNSQLEHISLVTRSSDLKKVREKRAMIMRMGWEKHKDVRRGRDREIESIAIKKRRGRGKKQEKEREREERGREREIVCV